MKAGLLKNFGKVSVLEIRDKEDSNAERSSKVKIDALALVSYYSKRKKERKKESFP
jgi:hypothetical protein